MKESRLYSLFEKDESGKFQRIAQTALKKSSAVRFFQNALLSGVFSGKIRELKPVKE